MAEKIQDRCSRDSSEGIRYMELSPEFSLGFFVIFAMGIFRSLDVILNRIKTR